ncbi:MAG: 16S rRNA (cytosine(967)-C(5))-methyltransferase RsmB, partial [Lachnospiraceae bacterium]|nr:16S rRNA (cytosine(967)-C(5))-methyltransferase RsmB [Lachnospiraceae bacterium]
MADIRNDCLNMMVAVLEEHRPSHLVIADYLDSHSELSDMDRSFIKRLVMGVIERRLMLDYVADAVSKTKTAKMKPVVRNLIRMGIYQLLYMNVPDSAACNESVKLAKKRGLANLSGFVNGVLRNIARQKAELTDLSAIKDDIKRLSLEYSVPEWIVRYYLDNYGIEAAKKAFEHYLTPSKTFIRCNSSRITPDELVERLERQGIEVQRTDIERCMAIGGFSSLSSIPEFKEGLFSVQDMSSVMAGEIADIRGGENVLDMCAAPGGKSMNIADRILSTGDPEGYRAGKESGRGNVLSCDISEQKVRLIKENVDRCGFKNITTRVNDASVFVPEFENAFDIVIADVPCSGI